MLAHIAKRKFLSFKQIISGKARISFSQFGEDLQIMSALQVLNITNPTYLDIGANDPVMGNNTYFFYQRNFKGVLVEPNPILYQKLLKIRPRDTSLNVGIGDKEEKKTYYLFAQNNALNTFSEEEMMAITAKGIKLEKTMEVQLKNINNIIDEFFPQPPTIISIDVEGLDEAILHTLDFTKNAPRIICIETISYSSTIDNSYTKRDALIKFILSKGYTIFADTFFNTIFVS